MLVAVVAVGAIIGVLRRHASRFGPPRVIGVIFAAAGVQLVSGLAHGLVHTLLLSASLALGVVWIALQPRHLPQVLLAIGFALNLAVVAANGGMPVDPAAMSAVGRRGTDVADGFLYKHVAMTVHTRLSWLGDRLPVPVQGNVVSVGDVIMAIAIGLWVADIVAGRQARRGSAGAVHGQLRRRARHQVIGRRE